MAGMSVSADRIGRLRVSPLFLGVQLLLVVLAVSRYDATSYLFRGTTAIDFFNWFWRYRLLGFISFFDVLICILVGLAAAGVLVSRRWWPRRFDALVYGLLLAVAMSGLIRFVQRDVEDTSRGFLFQLRNYAYFAAAYAVASRLRWGDGRRRWFAGLAAGLAILTIALSWWEIRHTPARFLIWKYGRAVNVRDLSDYLFIFFLQFWAAALLLERLPRRWWQRALLAAVLTYSLYGVFTGVGRGVVIVYPAVFVYLAWYFRLFQRRWFVACVASGLVLVTVAGSYVLLNADRIGMRSPLYIYTTFRSRETAVATRGQEVGNFVANLYQRNALLLGIGLGNKWYEFLEQPKEDLGAFPQEERGSDWHLGMHVPFLRLGLDFGIAGTVLVLTLFGACFLSTMRALRSGRFDGVTSAFMLSSWAVIGYQVSVNNLSGPKTNLLAGLLLGAVAGMLGESTSAEQG
jgi:hypothetical protein